MKLTVIGTGYVGLVTGACFAEMGNCVTCIDVNTKKIENLHKGILPIYEPGLKSIVDNNSKQGRLRFSTSVDDQEALDANIFFIAVGTPPGEDGSADLQYVLAAARDLGRRIKKFSIIVDKSTVPVGTAEKVRTVIQQELDNRSTPIPFEVVSNPEFLKEGAAVEDFMKPDRIIIGTDNDTVRATLRDLYAPFMRNRERIFFMGIKEAEMTKYAANAMLATKISFMNEISNLCDRMGVDVESVRRGIGSDPRIGHSFIYPGAGYGGSCFPKDVKALVRMAYEHDFDPLLLKAVEARNEEQKNVLFNKVTARFGKSLHHHTFALWGLAFKPGTDDMREAPAAVLIKSLIGAGARVKAYDPVAMPVARREFPADWFDHGRLELVSEQYEALPGADALILVTEWKPFRHPDFDRIKKLLRHPVIFDGRNQYDPVSLRAAGFEYSGIGR